MVGASRPSKRPRLEASPEEEQREDANELLARLNAQCAAFFGSTSANTVEELDEGDEGSESDSQSDEADDFAGFDSEVEGQEDYDDGEDLLDGDTDTAPVLVFDDPSRKRDAGTAAADVKSFMSARVGRQLQQAAQPVSKKARKEAKQEEEEESQLKQLDASLADMLKGFVPSDMGSSVFSHTRKQSSGLQKNVPLPIRKGIEHSRIKRAKRDAEADRIAGTVRARGGGLDNGPAITKREMRKSSGVEDKRRREARGVGGVVGRMGPGGSMLRLSADEVRRGNDGKGVDMLVRARKSGGFEGNRRLMTKSFARKSKK